MRNILALIGLLVIGFGGLGWYLGWYKLSYTRGTDGNIQITTDVNTKKVGTDTQEAFNNAATAISNQAEKAAQDAKASAPNGAPGGTPGPLTPPQNLPSIPAVSGPPVPPASETPHLPIPSVPSLPMSGPIPLIPPK